VAGVAIYLNSHLESILKEQIALHTDGSLRVDFEDIDINVLSQSAKITAVKIARTDSGFVSWSGGARQIRAEDLSVFSLLTGAGISLDSIVIEGLDVYFHDASNRSQTTEGGSSERRTGKKKLPIEIKGVRISSGGFDYDPEGPMMAKGQFGIAVRNFELDSIESIDFHQNFVNTRLNICLEELVSGDSLYVVRIDSIAKDFGDVVVVNELTLDPLLDLTEFSKYFGWNKGMLQSHVGNISTTLDLSSFPDSVKIPKCLIEASVLSVKKDNRWPFPDRVTPMPQEILTNLPLKFELDSLQLREGRIEMSLIHETGEEASLNVDNITADLRAQNFDLSRPAIEFSAILTVMGAASSTAAATYPYGENHPFTFKLGMEDTKLSFMSGFLQKAIGVRITEGRLNRFEMDMTGNEKLASGSLIFEYENLSVDAVDKETGKKKVALNALADVLGSLVFWKENPAHNDYRTGEFEVERDVRQAFIAQWFDGLQAGVVNVVAKIDPLKARDNKEEKKEKNHRHSK
jgi:hypothetical protein